MSDISDKIYNRGLKLKEKYKHLTYKQLIEFFKPLEKIDYDLIPDIYYRIIKIVAEDINALPTDKQWRFETESFW